MTKKRLFFLSAALALLILGPAFLPRGSQARPDVLGAADSPDGCTVIMVAKGASVDGSTMATHTCDCGVCDWTWRHVEAADHKPGETRKIYHINQYKTWPVEEGLKWTSTRTTSPGWRSPRSRTLTPTITACSVI